MKQQKPTLAATADITLDLVEASIAAILAGASILRIL